MTKIEFDDQASEKFAALDLEAVALLLDVDGTLIDIGPTPQDVHVPGDLRDALARLSDLTGGALALVSGRPIADLDRLFAPLRLSLIGGHGAEMRVAGETINRGIAQLPETMRRILSDGAAPGVLVEDKGYSLAMHFRGAPGRKDSVERLIGEARAAFPGEAVELLPGKEMLEVKRPAADKGEAVRALMRQAPFSGRVPVFIGDDVTDEAVFAILPQLNGIGFSVERHYAGLSAIFDSPERVRGALLRLVERNGKALA